MPTDQQRQKAFFRAVDARREARTWETLASAIGLEGGAASLRSMRNADTRVTRERVLQIAQELGADPADLWEGWPETAPEPNKRRPTTGAKLSPTQKLALRVERIEKALETAGILDASVTAIQAAAQEQTRPRRKP